MGGPADGELVDELPEGYVDLGTDSVDVDDLDHDAPMVAEYEG